WAVGHTSGRLF
nr:immunoglobulin light chain junction region [Macaca mulatta]